MMRSISYRVKFYIAVSVSGVLSILLLFALLYSDGFFSESISPELAQAVKKNRILVKPPNGEEFYVYPLQDEQSKLLDAQSAENHAWFKSMCQIGMEDRELPYDGLGYGKVTFRMWWGKSPNAENFTGDMWFMECLLGGSYEKVWEVQERNTWKPILNYSAGSANSAYVEMHPDGHIMNYHFTNTLRFVLSDFPMLL